MRLFKLLFLLIMIFLSNLYMCTHAYTEMDNNEIIQNRHPVSHEILIKFKPFVNESEKELVRQSLRAIKVKFIKSIQVEYWKLPENTMIDDALKILKKDPIVEHVEPGYINKPNISPNDPHFRELWYLKNTGQLVKDVKGKIGADISASKAWDIETGNHNIIIAVIDSGVAYDHPDLKENIWINKNEIPGNGIDDDRNDYIDDICGWDFFYNDNDPSDYSGEFRGSGHGTHVAGIIAAHGNNATGISGVMWKAQIMSLRIGDLGFSRKFKSIHLISAIEYAVNNGAKIINCSLGRDPNDSYKSPDSAYSQFEHDIIEYANQKGVLIVASAGNDSNDNDMIPHFPSGYDLPNIISVAATDQNDKLTSYSNFGPYTVDLAAPGGNKKQNIYSTIPPERDTLFFEDFESEKGLWQPSGNDQRWFIGKSSPGDSKCLIHSKYNYIEMEEPSMIITSSIDIKIYKDLCLEFDIMHQLQEKYDYLFLDVSFDGDNFSNISYFTGSGDLTGDSKYSARIKHGNKEKLYLRFVLKTDNSINYDVVYIDDIKLTGTPFEFNGDEYDYMSGTSMAAPVVSGIAGLVWSYNPDLNHLEVKNAILNSVDNLSSLKGKVLTDGRANAYNALLYLKTIEENDTLIEESGCFIGSLFI